MEQVVKKRVSSRGLQHQDQLWTVFQGAQAEQLPGAGTKAVSDIRATHSTAAGAVCDPCTEAEHVQQAGSSVATLQASNEPAALPRKGSQFG